ncbi:MAG: hydantoinase/oxoprolinase family protein, partial [Gemmatimonadales bacterium]|nr:hydantoinase/oxoprolinase family protein [Gemmatimonadales bacterium]
LDIMEKVKYDIYDLLIEYPVPLVAPQDRREIDERVDRHGRIVRPLDTGEVVAAARDLVESGVEAMVVCFLHSYRHAAHERAAVEAIREACPDLIVACSSEICPDIGEFMRFSTASINMYIRPRMERYLTHLASQVATRGFAGKCYMMLSTGATADFEYSRKLPIQLIESGPAAGAMAAAYYGRLIGIRNLISFDMGGTTAKACVVEDGRPAINFDHFEVARVHRFKKGSGMPLKAQSIDMIEIGAGGGSIARKDELGLLKVGPDSAESNPGPACYGIGGVEPTVTDANLVLGYLDPGYFLGGKMSLDKERARQAIAGLAGSLGLDELRAAWGIHEVVSESMASAARTHLLEQGRDSRRYAMFAFGGSGPVHGCRVAENLGIRTVICALGAGTLSALGLLIAPMAFDFVHTDVALLDDLAPDAINDFFVSAQAQGRQQLKEAGIDPAAVTITRYADLRYSGQGYEIGVSLPDGPLTEASRAAIAALFAAEYERLYGRVDPDKRIETVNWRLVASGPSGEVPLDRWGETVEAASSGRMRKGSREVYFPELGKYVETPVYDRYAMPPETSVAGPAIVEEKESTVIVIPGWDARVDRFRNLIVERRPARAG